MVNERNTLLFMSPLMTVRELRRSFLDIPVDEDEIDTTDAYEDYKREAVRELNSR